MVLDAESLIDRRRLKRRVTFWRIVAAVLGLLFIGMLLLRDDGKTYRQSLLWYKRPKAASPKEREEYEISTIGIHWRKLDEDVSFESVEYDDAEPTRLQKFFLSHPEINISGFAKKFGYNPSLLSSYVNGFKTPSPEREQQIMDDIIALGKELAKSA